MQRASSTYDVVIVGFGPSGAMLANLLGRSWGPDRPGLRTLVVEKAPEIFTLPRAVHFDHEVMRHFQSVGLAEAILPHTGPVSGYEFKNAEGKTLLSFELGEAVTSQGWRPDYMFHQPALEQVLRDGATTRESVELRLGQELVGLAESADAVTLALRNVETGEEERVRSRYVVGCDGASSPTRELLGLTTQDLSFDEPWLVVDATVERPPQELGFPHCPLQLCDPARPTTAIPVVGPHIRWEFMLLPGEGLEMQEPQRVRELVAAWIDPDQIQIIRSAVYRFHALIGEQWRSRGPRGRVLLAGDAVHQMPPFLGQGMCAGIRDAANLAWKLRFVLEERAGDALLDTYQQERAPHVRSVIDTAVEMGRIICTQDPALARLRDEQLLAGSSTPGAAPGSAPGGLPSLPGLAEGLLEAEPRHSLVGQQGLQAQVRDEQGASKRFDDLQGPGFVLIWRGEAQALSDDAEAVVERLGVRQLTLASRGNGAARRLDDASGEYADWLDRNEAAAVLIRPDYAVFGVTSADTNPSGLLRRLASGVD